MTFVSCPNGHEYHEDHLDKVGMDLRCPECGRVVPCDEIDGR